MKIDAYFSNAVVYDIQNRIDIKQGEECNLVMDDGTMIRVFGDQDSVLTYQQNGAEVLVLASNFGESELQFQNGAREIIRIITIRVVSQISLPTADLGITVAVEPK